MQSAPLAGELRIRGSVPRLDRAGEVNDDRVLEIVKRRIFQQELFENVEHRGKVVEAIAEEEIQDVLFLHDEFAPPFQDHLGLVPCAFPPHTLQRHPENTGVEVSLARCPENVAACAGDLDDCAQRVVELPSQQVVERRSDQGIDVEVENIVEIGKDFGQLQFAEYKSGDVFFAVDDPAGTEVRWLPKADYLQGDPVHVRRRLDAREDLVIDCRGDAQHDPIRTTPEPRKLGETASDVGQKIIVGGENDGGQTYASLGAVLDRAPKLGPRDRYYRDGLAAAAALLQYHQQPPSPGRRPGYRMAE